MTGPATPLGLDPSPCPERRGVSREAVAAGSGTRLSLATPLSSPFGFRGERSVSGKGGERGFSLQGRKVREFNLGFLDKLGTEGGGVRGDGIGMGGVAQLRTVTLALLDCCGLLFAWALVSGSVS